MSNYDLTTPNNVEDASQPADPSSPEQERLAWEDAERYQQLVTSSPQAILIHCEGKIVYINEAGVKLAGAGQAEEVVGRPVLSFVHPDSRAKVIRRIAQVETKQQEVEWLEEKIVRLDGAVVDVLVKGFPTHYEGQRAIQLLIIDLAEQKRAELLINNFLELSTSLLCILTPEGHFKWLNSAWEQLLGYSILDLYSLSLPELLHPEDHAPTAVAIKALQEPGGTAHFENRCRCRDGSYRWFAWDVARPTKEGLLYCVAHDLTERKQAEVSLRKSEEQYRELYNSVQRQAQELSLLHHARTVLARELELSKIIQKVVEAIADTFGYSHVSIFLLQDNQLAMQHQVGYEHIFPTIPVSEGITGRVIRTGQAVLLEDVSRDPDFLQAVSGIASEICVPLFHRGKVAGILNVETKAEMPLTRDDLHLMKALGEHISLAIERAHLYSEMREREARFRALIEHSTDMIVLVNPAGEISYVSPSSRVVLGRSPEEMIGRNVMELIHPRDRERTTEQLEALVQSSKFVVRTELRVRHPTGTWRWLEAIGNNALDAPGLRALVVNNRDITERKEVEAKLRESERRYRTLWIAAQRQARELSLLNQARTALAAELDLAGMIRAVVEGIIEIFGYTRVSIYWLEDDTLVLKHHVGYDEIEHRLVIGEGIAGEATEKRSPILLEDASRLEQTDAEERITSKICVPLLDQQQVVGILNVETLQAIKLTEADLHLMTALGEHISLAIERARLYTEVRKSEERYRSVVSNIKEVIFQTDLEGRWLFLNPAWQEITGYAIEESLGGCCLDYVHPHERMTVLKFHRMLINGLLSECQHELRCRTAGGTYRWVELFARVQKDERGKPITIFGTLNDITERKKGEQALRRQNEYLAALHDMTLGVINRLDLEELLEAIIMRAAQLVGGEHGYIYLHDPAKDIMEIKVALGHFRAHIGMQIQEGEGLSGEVWQSGKPVSVEYYGKWPRRLPNSTWDEFRAVMAVPLTSGSQVVGVIGLARVSTVEPFHKREVRVLSRFAHLASIALDNAHLYRSLQQELTERKQAQRALLRSRQRVVNILESITDAFFTLDNEWCFTYLNPQAEQLLQRPKRELLYQNIWEEFPAAKGGRFYHAYQRAIREQISVAFEAFYVPLDCWFDVRAYPSEEGLSVYFRDITERKEAEEALRQSEERYKLAALGANDGLWDWDLRGNKVYYSPRWKAMLGYADDEIADAPGEWFNRVHPEDFEQLKVQLDAHLRSVDLHFETSYRMRHKDGSYRWILCRGLALRDEAEQVYRMAGSQTDITERKRAEQQLLHAALHDTLTGLPNRSLFMDRLQRAIDRTRRHPEHLFAVLFLDLDRFKLINDSLGHLAGDDLLVHIARRLEECIRPTDTVARLGGDEFTILVEDMNHESDAIRVANRVHDALSLPFDVQEQEVFVTASIGIVPCEANYEHPEEFLRNADIAMYRAKSLGKARHEVFDRAMHERAVALLKLETDLRHAIERGEFRLHFQPIISLHSGRISGFEALLRWEHPKEGLVFPGHFIPIAEETGLILPIGDWVIREACRQMQEWHDAFPTHSHLTINVNLSGKQLTQPELVGQIDNTLRETKLPAACLKLEITESAIMHNAESVTSTLGQLRALGVYLQLDDFGTGYSSLGYLHRFPIDTLKIDRSFINKLGMDGENAAIVQTIVTLAHSLEMDVVAEGVENAEQLQILRELQCEYGQGFFFAPALPTEEARRLLQQRDPFVAEVRN